MSIDVNALIQENYPNASKKQIQTIQSLLISYTLIKAIENENEESVEKITDKANSMDYNKFEKFHEIFIELFPNQINSFEKYIIDFFKEYEKK